MGDTETSLFQGQTAWFSNSVLEEKIKLWEHHGGLLAGIDHAQFVFSEDEEAPDTKMIFSSEAYIDEHLAVFHALYVSDAVKQKYGPKILLGDYFLPPKDIQQLIRKQMKFKWEHVNESNKDDSNSDEEEGATLARQAAEGISQYGKEIRCEGEDYVNIAALSKITGEIVDFVPGKDGCEVGSKNKAKP
ncbi:telomere repeats-binding bouquet formation protein 2-like [Ylistrum balloti]|uniref:telomere repeats-binding bouquet formation protein 2-like n=1 Tax=Ylistrum balloti TaxID=509963 RepID=UPI0029059604|nr:telomere repeats-binding bouquet formation protein 2-like [Ylistrum balloti]